MITIKEETNIWFVRVYVVTPEENQSRRQHAGAESENRGRRSEFADGGLSVQAR